ncbi:Gsr2395 protein [Olavius sp. associated proteobacterium Delta 1]|nr:Gsr2395 protein [Olavius sp. associated proteobacterium Delta 1]
MIDRITIDSKIHFGKPCIAGTRITVQSVLELLNEGLSFNEIIQNYYPELDDEDIRASIQYAIALVASEDIHLVREPV